MEKKIAKRTRSRRNDDGEKTANTKQFRKKTRQKPWGIRKSLH